MKDHEKCTRVLFLCRDNATRSLIAEAVLRAIDGYRFDANSAGANPGTSAHALTMQVLQVHHVSTQGLFPKHVENFFGESFDYVIALHDRMREELPSFPGAEILSWSFADPLTAHDPAQAFERLFFELSQRIRLLIIIIERFFHRRGVNAAVHAFGVESATSSPGPPERWHFGIWPGK